MLSTNTKGSLLQSFSISIDEQQLTDQISFVTAEPMNIMEQVQGKYLDYEFSACIEQTTQNGILYSCQCCSDIDELLYTPINYEISESDREKVKTGNQTVESGTLVGITGNISYDLNFLPSVQLTLGEADQLADEEVEACLASSHVNCIAGALGVSAVQRYDDFFSSMALEQKDVTYNDLISTLFGWTSRIESLMVNAYLRNGVLYIIQRGREEHSIDITDTKHTLPVITRQLVRKTWATQDDSSFTLHTRLNDLTVWARKGSLAERLFVDHDNDTSYSYTSDKLISSKTTTSADGSTSVTTYQYQTHKGYKYLAREVTTNTDADGNTTTRETTHTPLGNGQMETRVYEDGEFVSSVIGPGIKNSEPSERTLNDEANDIVQIGKIEGSDFDSDVTVEGNPLIDPSFPVYNSSKLEQLTSALRAMNRQTQETISMDIYNYQHVIDFNDRITFHGAQFFLKSNRVEKSVVNLYENKQSIQIVRWY